MQKTTNSTEIINEIAGMIVMLEPDDIQALGDILKLLDDIDDSGIEEYILHVKQIVERLILDEYESPTVGIEELGTAAEHLQIALNETEQVSEEELEEKQGNVESATEEDETQEHTIKLDEEPPSSKADNGQQQKDKSKDRQTDKETAPKKKKKKAEPQKKSVPTEEVSETSIEHDGELNPDEDEDIASYFSQRDDPDLIYQTIKEDPELIQGFLDESYEHLQMIENGLIDWEANPNDLTIIDSIFRPFHTIKGVSGFLNLSDINAFSHMYEDILDDVRKGVLEFDEDLSEAIFEGVDALKSMVNTLGQAQQKKEYVQHPVNLDYFVKKVQSIKTGSAADASPVEEDLDDSDEIADEPIKETKASKSSKSKAKKGSGLGGADAKGSRAMGNRESSLRVSTGKMDSLIDLVGELVVTQNMVVQNEEIKRSTDKRLLQDVGQLKRITSNLQDLSMSLRMVPIKDTFQRMHRIVRDYSRKTGKKIVLEIRGEETEIDRNMVDELYDPLVHMIRNNCDHGIEKPATRKARGKSETGTIALNAYYKGGMVIIEIKDDGNGIDTDKLLKRAIERGIADEGRKYSKSEILNFIFASGFSTVDSVTDVSGRGVGMDVVKRAINNLRGSVDIETELGKGSTFTLRLPLTLAIIDGVLVEVGEERYIIPTVSIKESLVTDKSNYNRIAGKGETVFIRNKVLPLIRLDEYFQIENAIKEPSEGLIIIVESDKHEAALLVDKMIDKQEIVIKSLGESLSSLQGLAGGAILSDGSVGLIVDIPTLLPKTGRTF
jgi:two-component system chemotaxis sensor kinase CheA